MHDHKITMLQSHVNENRWPSILRILLKDLGTSIFVLGLCDLAGLVLLL